MFDQLIEDFPPIEKFSPKSDSVKDGDFEACICQVIESDGSYEKLQTEFITCFEYEMQPMVFEAEDEDLSYAEATIGKALKNQISISGLKN